MNMVRFLVAKTLVKIAKLFSKLAIKIVGYGYYEINIQLILKPLRNKDVDFWIGISLLILAIAILIL